MRFTNHLRISLTCVLQSLSIGHSMFKKILSSVDNCSMTLKIMLKCNIIFNKRHTIEYFSKCIDSSDMSLKYS